MILVSHTQIQMQAGSQLQTRPQTRAEPRRRDQEPTRISGEPKAAETSLGWVYVGSANLSESAWYVRDPLPNPLPPLFCKTWGNLRQQGKKRAPTASAMVRLCSALLATSSGYFENDWDAIVMIFSNLMLTVAAMVRRTGAALSRTERQDSLK